MSTHSQQTYYDANAAFIKRPDLKGAPLICREHQFRSIKGARRVIMTRVNMREGPVLPIRHNLVLTESCLLGIGQTTLIGGSVKRV